MKFITVTLNPALDMNIAMQKPLKTDALNRSDSAAFSPGGKGVNVSRALRALGQESDAVCILGGFTGAKMRTMLTAEGVTVRAVATTAATRVNIAVMTPDGRQCEINNPPICESETETDSGEGKNSSSAGIRPAEETAQLIMKTKLLIRRLIDKNLAEGERSAVILAGSIPPDMPKNTYADMIRLCREKGAASVVDCDGEALRCALAAHPSLIKPNMAELAALTERRLTKEMIPQAGQEVCVSTGGETEVLATAGEYGAFLCRSRDSDYAPAVNVERVRTLKGAGDTFLAAYLHYHYNGDCTSDAALNAAARCAAKKIATPGGAFPTLG